MPLTHDDINLYRFLKKVIEFKHMTGNWEKPTYNFHGKEIPFDPVINTWARNVFTKRGLPQYASLFTDRNVFETVYSGLLFKHELKFLATPELLKTEEEEGLGDDFHNLVKADLDKIDPDLKNEVYPPGPAPVKKGEKTPPKFYMAPEEEEEETETEGEEPETMATEEERQEPAQTQVPHVPPSTQEHPSQTSGSNSPPQQPIGVSTGPQMPQMPQTPRISMPRYSPQPKIPKTPPTEGVPTPKSRIPTGLKDGLKGAGRGLGAATKDMISRGGNAGMNALAASRKVSSGSNLLKKSRTLRFALLGGFFMFILVGLIQPLFFSEDQPTVVAAPIIPPGNIATCSFTRADQTPKAAVYKSPNLMGFFQEASAISTVPAVVLAAFARVESPSLVNKTDADIINLSTLDACPRSETGALGVMQLQPPGTLGHAPESINNGAKYIGKTVDTLTETDYCNVRTSVIVASGFLLKKLQVHYSLGDGTKWDPTWTNNKDVLGKLGEIYYGCPKYGAPLGSACSDPRNIYGYGDDILASVQACKAPATGTTSCPVAGGTISTPSYNADPVNGHCGSKYNYTCNCETGGRRAKAIDVPTEGKDVVLPKINGQDVNWKFIFGPYGVDSGEGGGSGYTFEATVGSDKWYLDMLHLGATSLQKDQSYLSGKAVSKSVEGHVHMTTGKNNTVVPLSPGANPNSTDCDPGWLSSDFMCQ